MTDTRWIIEIYSKPGCHLCDEAKAELVQACGEFDMDIREINILSDPALFEKYHLEIPVVYINGKKEFKVRVDAGRLRRIMKAGRPGPHPTGTTARS